MNRKFPKYKCEKCGEKKISKKAKCAKCAEKPAPEKVEPKEVPVKDAE